MILFRRANWSLARAFGILFSWISLTTLLGFAADFPIGQFDFHLLLVRYFGFVP